MPKINDQDYKEYLKEVSETLQELAIALESYAHDEENEILKQAYKELIAKAERMHNDMGDIIVKISISTMGR